MKPRITVITLGVNNLETALNFYREGLGFQTEGIIGSEFEHGAVVFIQLQPGLRLALWPRKSIAHDTGLPLCPPSATEITLGHNVQSKSEVDSIMAKAAKVGAKIVKGAHDTFWGGYSGYFQDPDGHLWEIVWNPRTKSTSLWWLLFSASVALLPLIPTASILGLGWLFPGQVPWLYADASVPIGALLAVSAFTFLLTRSNFFLVARLLALGAVIFCMSFFARIELVFAQACITQRGSHINFQQQQRDLEAAKGATCDSQP